MSIRTAILCAVFGVAAAATPMISNARVYLDVDIAPPAARVEVVPAARPGYVWAAGYWNWTGHRHNWVAGHWIRAHRGSYWVPDRWDQRGKRWHHDRGHWERDRHHH